MLEPENDNHSTFDRVFDDPNFAEGLLIRAYTFIPTNDYRFDEVATDDAVTNDRFSSFMRMATGEWSALNNPQDLWTNSNRAITYINEFLTIVNDVPWKWTDEELNDLYIRRLTGEAYALRGLFKYY
ncbi:MAG: RagB/SusD family nutrient uptake outer membrane protein, partial [Proteiniphilum sp.]|nr:RagB/SusD family nutrient uptake outer membrane protein [Proteiniphilum sp.]